MSPRSASTTNPVAWLDEFHSVSNARVLSMRIDTTPEEMRSSVSLHSVFSAASDGAKMHRLAMAVNNLPKFIGILGQCRNSIPLVAVSGLGWQQTVPLLGQITVPEAAEWFTGCADSRPKAYRWSLAGICRFMRTCSTAFFGNQTRPCAREHCPRREFGIAAVAQASSGL
jgi:hypothetical protein